jgi:hypothetical protein
MKEQITGNSSRGRRAGRLVGALGLLLALVLLGGGVLPAYANDLTPPLLPHLFAGTVSTTNSPGPVPEGTVVEAWMDDVKKAETAVNETRYQLVVPGEVGDEGKIVSFKVAGVQADQTAAWVSGALDNDFDLTIASLPPDGGSSFPFCFIATAAYGTDTAEEIDTLREFRDVVLLPSGLGAELVSLYYKTSPPIAEVISQHDFLRTAVKVGFVDPVVAILNWSYALWSERG